ncbi:MAG: Asp-tRNA(Asn)/Glu-tRNA(Gln) amidotransferase subunit GatB, partial [Patescibacteria group bacterium]
MYEAVIGLEIHAQLKTDTKLFCDSRNDPDERHPNINVCPVCMGHPGTLPVANKKAVEAVVKVGLALGSTIARFSKFDRKNYFYPDLPKGYQISQYDMPLCEKGVMRVGAKDIGITRVHLEEDTGRLVHGEGGASLVDFNRAGVPLMELVTEPDIRTAEEAAEFAKKLQMLFQYLGVSGANMEKGQMRCEVNISMRKAGEQFGTKVEIKNLNSFGVVKDAIAYEIKRQTALLEHGEKVAQETRGWDEHKKATVSQRMKESAHDYRYFPEPDLPPLNFT